MKKIALTLSIIMSAFLLTSCANKSASTDQTAMDNSAAQTSAAPAHHRDYKGEMK
ncbi:MAG TPA: hypothetical protein VJL60_04500 [Gammaproteobacteria bacterium]|nr:hypothetical protein [Gammaproteobacteria bacterium]